jgi:hypothetical protein
VHIKLVTTPLAIIGLAVCAHAQQSPDIGATIDQLKVRYGKVQKVEPAWCGGTAYGFQPSPARYIYVIVAPGESVVSDVMYVKTVGYGTYGVGLWDKDHQAEMQQLFAQNQINGPWDFHDYYAPNWTAWYHSRVFNKVYWQESEPFGTRTLTANTFDEKEIGPAYKEGWHGFQVRTLQQFKNEGKFAKKLQADAKKQPRGKVTVGMIQRTK